MLSFLRAVLHRIGLQELVAVPQANVTSALTRFVIDIAKDKDKHIDRQKNKTKTNRKTDKDRIARVCGSVSGLCTIKEVRQPAALFRKGSLF